MNKVTSHRKRPCGICRRWFRPDPRVKKRQKTCGDPACMREWHRRKCAEWNRQNAGIIQRERLVDEIKTAVSQSGQGLSFDRSHHGAPPDPNALRMGNLLIFAQEVMATQLAVMIQVLLQHFVRRAQEVMRRQAAASIGQFPQQPPLGAQEVIDSRAPPLVASPETRGGADG